MGFAVEGNLALGSYAPYPSAAAGVFLAGPSFAEGIPSVAEAYPVDGSLALDSYATSPSAAEAFLAEAYLVGAYLVGASYH